MSKNQRRNGAPKKRISRTFRFSTQVLALLRSLEKELTDNMAGARGPTHTEIIERALLQLAETRGIPIPGHTKNAVAATVSLPQDDPFWGRMQRMWDEQKARGHIPRSVEEVEKERAVMREEWEQRMRRIEQLRMEAEKLQKKRECIA